GAVPAAGATERNGEVAFSFADIVRHQIDEQALNALEEFTGLGKGTDVTADLGILAGVFAQPRHEVRVREEAHVEDEIRIGGHAIAIAEADERNQHGALIGILEALGNEMAKFMYVEFRRVDDNVGEFADGLHELALVPQAFAHGKMFAEGVRAARLAVAA